MHKSLYTILVPDSYNIEPARTIFQFLLMDISFRRSSEQLLFRRRHRLFRETELRISSHLHFNEYQFVLVSCDDVNLTMIEGVVSLKDCITLMFQKGYGKSLSILPDIPLGCIPRHFHSHFKILARIIRKISKRKMTIGTALGEAPKPSFEEKLLAR
jgi:hypothetical protein